jgi:DNA helicase MCM8
MLQAAANIVPRGVYVCGNTTTTSGLTVTLSKDGASGDYALEAGALVLGDMGCCCIDEFDKMGSQHQALLEAMEQQSISIAKAGIVCSLPARTSILAAANPAGGHYNKAKTVAENLKMGSALLSRFDLVFILLDKPDEEMDMMLSEHVMALHAGKRRCVSSAVGGRVESVMDLVDDDGRKEWEKDKPLSERLKVNK